jgi:AcrR family transcriptional regulator
MNSKPSISAPRRTYRHGDLRRSLLEAGIAMARQGGPDAVVLREATRQAGVAPNAAYRHFASQQALLQAVREHALAAAAAMMGAELARIPATLVLFESGPRLADTLAALASGFGERPAAICRELTKLHEEVRGDTLAQLARDYAQGRETRGDIVIVIAPPPDEAPPDANELDAIIRGSLKRLSLKDAVSEIAQSTGVPRREVYQRALILAKEK